MDNDLQKAYLASLERAENSTNKQEPELWVVASGKGGVGKTFVSSSLGITLSKLGHTVVILDFDISGANIHTSLGLKPSHTNIRHYFENDTKLSELTIPTQFPRLSYIQGFWDSWSPTDFSCDKVQAIIPELKKLKADYIIVDLGAGALESHLEFFKAANEKFLISTPEPTSIEKTYRFIEAYICHSVKSNSTPEAYEKLINTLRLHRQGSLDKHFSFRSYLNNQPGFQINHFEALSQSPIRLIVNSARSQSNHDLGHSMKSVCYKYYDLSIDFLISLDYDNAVWQSVRSREHVLMAHPFTSLAGQFLTACKQLIAPEELRAVV